MHLCAYLRATYSHATFFFTLTLQKKKKNNYMAQNIFKVLIGQVSPNPSSFPVSQSFSLVYYFS